jgi:hypothetical protein
MFWTSVYTRDSTFFMRLEKLLLEPKRTRPGVRVALEIVMKQPTILELEFV